MKAVSKILTGAVGIAALAGMASPAAAQYYPGYNTGGGIVGQVLNTILNPYGQQGYGANYGMNSQAAVQQCSAAVQQRLAGYGGGYSPYASYGGYGAYNPYGGGYGNVNSGARIVAISQVEPRSSSTLRVRGLATSGAYAGYQGGYGGYGGYGNVNPYNAAASADLSFKCDIDYRGYVRDVDIDRRY